MHLYLLLMLLSVMLTIVYGYKPTTCVVAVCADAYIVFYIDDARWHRTWWNGFETIWTTSTLGFSDCPAHS